MTVALKQAVLVSVGRNPVSGACRASLNDTVALALSRRVGGEATVLHAGDPDEQALHDYLAYGAQTIEVLPAAAEADILPLLTQALQGYSLILCGDRAESGQGSGLLPYLLAKALNLPVISAALDVKLVDDSAEIVQFLPKGKRRTIRVKLPAIITVHRLASQPPAYVYAQRRRGRIVSQPGVAAQPAPSPWVSAPAGKRLVKFAPSETRQGHARMLAAIVLESTGGAVMKDGSTAEKVQGIMTYLRRNRLINF